jgi:acyl-CoA synthetase (NDP forming)
VGNSLGVVTVSGGAGVIISDAAEAAGLAMPEMPTEAQTALKAILPFAAPRNPVDVTAQFLNDLSLVDTFLSTMLSAGGYRSVLGFFTYTAGGAAAPRLREELRRARRSHPDRLFVLCAIASPEQVRGYEEDGFTVFEDPVRAVEAIAAMGRFGEAFARPARKMPPVPQGIALPPANPSEAQAKALLADAGIPAAPEQVATDAQAAVAAARTLGFPVVLKIVSPDIVHKTEIGGVILDVRDESAVREGFAALLARARAHAPSARLEGVLVARQMAGGIECIVGVHRDPVFGPVAMFGLGGIHVEVMRDVVFHRCPFDVETARRLVLSIRAAPLLTGVRGRATADIEALAVLLSRVSTFAAAAGPRLAAVDLNPVVVMPAGQGAWALDAVIEVTSG